MSTELSTTESKDLKVWEESSLQEIKTIFAPNLTNLEFSAFVGMGKATALNPFLKEIWAVKYDKTKPAQIFIGRDGYRKSAQRHPDYDYHHVDAIYSNDEFEVHNGKINHKYKFMKRGELLGAYCLVKRKNSSIPSQTIVNIKEYHKNQSTWNTMPETMIKKIAESQGLRAAFQEVFSGTYSEFEDVEKITGSNSKTEQLKQQLARSSNEKIIDVSPGESASTVFNGQNQSTSSQTAEDDVFENMGAAREQETPVYNSGRDDIQISELQLDEITSLLREKNIAAERYEKALAYFRVDCVENMSDAQARLFIMQLNKA